MKLQPSKKKSCSNPVTLIFSCLAAAFFLCAMTIPADAHPHAQCLPEKADMQKNIRSSLFTMHKSRDIAWLCYYGSNRDILSLPHYELLILEADALGPITRKDKRNRVCVAYMSIGEISQSRWFWQFAQNKPWLLKENPDWPGAFRVDPRSQEWSDLLISIIAPTLLGAGYDGFMLDNVDIGEYLESVDPQTYVGAKEAVEDIIRRLRQVYPDAVMIANGGLETAADTADCLDAVVCESIFSRWIANDDGSFIYAEALPEELAWLRPRLLRIRGSGLPILALDYAPPEDAAARQRAWEKAKKAGYHPYIAERDLMRMPPEESRSVESAIRK